MIPVILSGGSGSVLAQAQQVRFELQVTNTGCPATWPRA